MARQDIILPSFPACKLASLSHHLTFTLPELWLSLYTQFHINSLI
jgi:hypothetical protein